MAVLTWDHLIGDRAGDPFGRNPGGRAHLDTIEADAKAKGYNLVARKAAIARG